MSLPPPAGALVAYWEGSRLAYAVVGGEEKQRVRLVGARGDESRVTGNRVALVLERGGEAPGHDPESRERAAGRVRALVESIERRLADVDVGLVWELVAEEVEAATGPAGRTLAELAQLALGGDGGAEQATVAEAMLADGVRFHRRGDLWEARDRESVERLVAERRRVAERERQTDRLHDALRRAAAGEGWEPSGDELERRALAGLEELALYGDEAGEAARSAALAALAASGLAHDRPDEGAFRLLRRLGRFEHDDVSLPALRYRYPERFPDEVLAEAERVTAAGHDRDGREDLTALEALSIDGPRTTEIDDALSIESRPDGGWRLGIHIADPTGFVRPGGLLDREAAARGLTQYHPDLKVPMLPPAISERAASLVAGEERPALSFLVEVDGDGSIVGRRVTRSTVRCRHRLDYDAADAAIAGAPSEAGTPLCALDALARVREAARIADGALVLDAPEVDVRVGADGAIELERIGAGSASRRVVTEAMVLAGAVAASMCGDGGLPALYRRQPAPDLPPERAASGAEWDPVRVRRVRRLLRRGEVSCQPGPHHALALEAYAQVTSPLRRYQDLVNERQIVARLAGDDPPYDLEAMRGLAADATRAELESRRAEREADTYWTLRFLESRTGETVEAVVVDDQPRPVALLLETLHEQPVPALAGRPVGTRLLLRVERVNARAGRLVLRPVSQESPDLA